MQFAENNAFVTRLAYSTSTSADSFGDILARFTTRLPKTVQALLKTRELQVCSATAMRGQGLP